MTLQEFQQTYVSPAYWEVLIGAMTGNVLGEFAKSGLETAFAVTDPNGRMALDAVTKLGLGALTLYGSTEIPFGPGANDAKKFLEGVSIGLPSTLINNLLGAAGIDPFARARFYTSPVAAFASAWMRTLSAPGYVPALSAGLRGGASGAPAMPFAPALVPGESVKRLWGASKP